MPNHTPEISAQLSCHLCGYDLRAHPQDGRCPECGTSVAESRQFAAIPRRPAWRNSDPRWRRRILAGTWILLLLPLIDVLQGFGLASHVPVPHLFDRYTISSLDDTLIGSSLVYRPLAFCIGVVLLFSKERGRQPAKLDWTRRWGILCSYIVLLLSAVSVLFVSALVILGIAALYLNIALIYQPRITPLLAYVSAKYLLYGPHPGKMADLALIAFSSITIVLACVPLFDALRSSGPKWIAATLLAPLASFSLIHLWQVGHGLASSTVISPEALYGYAVYFWSQPLVTTIASLPQVWDWSTLASGVFIMEALKWSIILAIAVWLTIAQLAAWWRGRKQRQRP